MDNDVAKCVVRGCLMKWVATCEYTEESHHALTSGKGSWM